MKKGLVSFNWNDIEKFNEEEISYYLFLEGKKLNAISKIRNLTKEEVQEHIIKGKIKLGVLSKNKNEKELFEYLCTVAKEERIRAISYFNNFIENKLIEYIINNYKNMNWKYKEKSIWFLGEMKNEKGINVLLKASVNNNVNLRRLAVSALGKFESFKVESALIRALDDENPQVVQYAIKALEKIESKVVIGKIEQILNSTNKEYLKESCKKYLKNIKVKS